MIVRVQSTELSGAQRFVLRLISECGPGREPLGGVALLGFPLPRARRRLAPLSDLLIWTPHGCTLVVLADFGSVQHGELETPLTGRWQVGERVADVRTGKSTTNPILRARKLRTELAAAFRRSSLSEHIDVLVVLIPKTGSRISWTPPDPEPGLETILVRIGQPTGFTDYFARPVAGAVRWRSDDIVRALELLGVSETVPDPDDLADQGFSGGSERSPEARLSPNRSSFLPRRARSTRTARSGPAITGGGVGETESLAPRYRDMVAGPAHSESESAPSDVGPAVAPVHQEGSAAPVGPEPDASAVRPESTFVPVAFGKAAVPTDVGPAVPLGLPARTAPSDGPVLGRAVSLHPGRTEGAGQSSDQRASGHSGSESNTDATATNLNGPAAVEHGATGSIVEEPSVAAAETVSASATVNPVTRPQQPPETALPEPRGMSDHDIGSVSAGASAQPVAPPISYATAQPPKPSAPAGTPAMGEPLAAPGSQSSDAVGAATPPPRSGQRFGGSGPSPAMETVISPQAGRRSSPKSGRRSGMRFAALLATAGVAVAAAAATVFAASGFARVDMADYGSVCAGGGGVPAAAPYTASGASPVFLGNELEELVMFGPSTVWHPVDAGAVQLVACVSEVRRAGLVRTCQYPPAPGQPVGRTLNLFAVVYQLTLREARTGDQVTTREVIGDRFAVDPAVVESDPCRAATGAPEDGLPGRRHSRLSSEQISDALTPFVTAGPQRVRAAR